MTSLMNRKPNTSYLMQKLADFNSKSTIEMNKNAEVTIDSNPMETKTGLEEKKPEDNKTVEVSKVDSKDVTGEKLGNILEELMTLESASEEVKPETTVSNEVGKMDAKPEEPKSEDSEDKSEDETKEEPKEDLEPVEDDMEKESACGSKAVKKAYADEATTDLITLLYHNHIPNAKYAKIAEDAAVITKLIMIDKI